MFFFVKKNKKYILPENVKKIIKQTTNYIARFKTYTTTMIWRKWIEREVMIYWERGRSKRDEAK
jgi:hypothetical protein